MSYSEDIADNRTQLRRIDARLAAMQAGVASEDAARFIGQARALVRAAEKALADAEPIAAAPGSAAR